MHCIALYAAQTPLPPFLTPSLTRARTPARPPLRYGTVRYGTEGRYAFLAQAMARMGSTGPNGGGGGWVSSLAVAHMQQWSAAAIPWCTDAQTMAATGSGGGGGGGRREAAHRGGRLLLDDASRAGKQRSGGRRQLIGYASSEEAQRRLRDAVLYGCC